MRVRMNDYYTHIIIKVEHAEEDLILSRKF